MATADRATPGFAETEQLRQIGKAARAVASNDDYWRGVSDAKREDIDIDWWEGSRPVRVAPGSDGPMRNHVAEHALGLARSY